MKKLFELISFVARARTVTVKICVPQLPLIEATIGINVARATSFSIDPSNIAIMKEAVNAVPRFIKSQGLLLRNFSDGLT